MPHGDEWMDRRQWARAGCGALALLYLLFGGIGTVKHLLAHDWFEALYRLVMLVAAWGFGYFAITGRRPRKLRRVVTRAKGPADPPG